jgi:slit protein 2
MFSYEQIDDGEFHVIELLMSGKNLTMRIDAPSGLPRTIINDGDRTHMASTHPLFLGGLGAEVQDAAVKKWHIRNPASFNGCFKKVIINNRQLDFDTRSSASVQKFKVLPGCPKYEKTNPCDSHMCKKGKCTALDGFNYKCECRRGYSGAMCDIELWHNDEADAAAVDDTNPVAAGHRGNDPDNADLPATAAAGESSSPAAATKPSARRVPHTEPTCQGIEYREQFVDPKTGCRSRSKVKHRRCDGNCGNHCCVPKKIKTRKVRLFCKDGTNYIHDMPVIRKCGCKNCSYF